VGEVDILNSSINTGAHPELSVILPLPDADLVLPGLADALYAFLDGLGHNYEVLLIGHGGGERSATVLHQQFRLRPDVTRVLLGRGQASAAAATLAGIAACQGQRIIALPTDPSPAPETIGRVLDLLDLGHDFVAGKRSRQGLSAWQAWLARAESGWYSGLGGMGISDPGCGVFGCTRELRDLLVAQGPGLAAEWVPPMAFRLAREPAEVQIEVASRGHPRPLASSYALGGGRIERLYRHLNFLIGPSSWLMQAFAVLAMGIALLAMGTAILVAVFSLLFSDREAMGLLLELLLTGLGFSGLSLFGVYLERLPNKRSGDPGYIIDVELKAKPAFERRSI